MLNRMRELVGQNPRRGSRYIGAVLRREGWKVNHKKVERLWKREGYKVPKKRRKKRALGEGANACDKRAPEAMNDVWTWDFIHDSLTNGDAIKAFVLVDEFTRRCLALEMNRSMRSQEVRQILSRLFAQHGVPKHIRSDNGPEFIATEIKKILSAVNVQTLYIEPGAPWQNGYAEAFNSRLRDEFLEMNYFTTLAEARTLAASWKVDYNTKRLHGSLNWMTPDEFARRCGDSGSASLRSAPPESPQRNPPEAAA